MARLLIRPDADAIAQFIADDNLDAGRRFFIALAGGIDVLRVLHGARDVDRIVGRGV